MARDDKQGAGLMTNSRTTTFIQLINALIHPVKAIIAHRNAKQMMEIYEFDDYVYIPAIKQSIKH